MIWDLLNFKKIKLAIQYILVIAVVLVFQNLIFSQIRILGVAAMFVPVAIVAIGMIEGGIWGGLFGLLAGWVCDLNYSENLLMFTLLFPAVGYFSGLLSEYLLNRSFFPYFMTSMLALIITALCQVFQPLLFDSADPAIVAQIAGLQVLWSLPFTIPIYFSCRALSSRNE